MLDLLRCALGDLAAEVQHRDAMAQVHDDVHVVLDEEQIDAAVIDLAQDIHKLAALTRVQARGGLVEQDELRRRHQRAAKLADLLAAIGQIVDGLVAQMIHAESC